MPALTIWTFCPFIDLLLLSFIASSLRRAKLVLIKRKPRSRDDMYLPYFFSWPRNDIFRISPKINHPNHKDRKGVRGVGAVGGGRLRTEFTAAAEVVYASITLEHRLVSRALKIHNLFPLLMNRYVPAQRYSRKSLQKL
jgi:hypothetical protein